MAITVRSHNSLQSMINVTPLVDVALTLLIVFMMTAPMLQQGLPVNLPEAAAPALKRSKADVILTVQSGGKIFIGDDQETIPLDELEGRLGALYSAKQEKDLFVKADSELLYGTVVKIMSIAKRAGVDRIGMITQPESEAPPTSNATPGTTSSS